MPLSEDTRPAAHVGSGEQPVKPVVAALHGGPDDVPVVLWASDEAERLQVPLLLVHVVDSGVQFTPYPALVAGMPNLAQDLEGEALDLLAHGVEGARARHPSLEVVTSVPWGSPAGALVELSADARRLVLGASHRAGLERLLVGSVTAPVVAHARCPVVVVPDRVDVATPARIVVGVDGSPGSARAVELALEIATASGAAVTCAIGWSMEVTLGVVVSDPALGPVPDVEAECRAVAAAVVDPVAARHPGVPCEVVVRHGAAHEVVLDVAREAEADLVVIGSRGHGGFVGLLLGSVSRRVVHRASCVVAIAH